MLSKTKPIFVINAQGEEESFSFQKVLQSAKRAGAPENLAREIAETIQAEVQPGMKTATIFKRIKTFLSNRLPQASMRFSLKEGMRKLGPSGFPFEKYIQAILVRNNFWVEEAQMVSGRCTRHEIDFLAYAEDTSEVVTLSTSSEVGRNDFPFRSQNVFYIGECKYHQKPGARVDLGIALAHYALFLDIKEGQNTSEVSRFFNPKFRIQNQMILPNSGSRMDKRRPRRPPARWRKKAARMEPKPILVTNTKFTSQAIEYASCVGMDLLGWKYPPNNGLESLIDNQRLYPLTILPSVSRDYSEALFAEKIVLIEDILKANVHVLAQKTGIPRQALTQITEEARLLKN